MTALEYTNLVQHIAQSLRPVALNLTRDADDAKDLVQETMLKALLHREKFQAGSNMKAWLFTIMRNTFINSYNKITKRSSDVDTTEVLRVPPNEGYIARNNAVADFVLADVHQAIGQLPEELRTPFMMYFTGFKYQEIAEQQQIPIGTVKNRIHLARKELKHVLSVYESRT